jgi:hypothetical protein
MSGELGRVDFQSGGTMCPTKAELEIENRQLRKLVGEVYDRVAEQIEFRPLEDEEDEGDEEDEIEDNEDL